LLIGIASYAYFQQTASIPYYYMPDRVWQAHFKDRTFSEFNGGLALGCGHTGPLTPSPYLHHTISVDSMSSTFSEFDYYYGPPNKSLNSTMPCRAYQSVNLEIRPYDKYNLDALEISITIMIPSQIYDERVNVTGWLSFVTASAGSMNDAWTIDSNNRDLHLWLACLNYVDDHCESGTMPSATAYRWTFDEPFTIHAVYIRSTEVIGQRIIVWVQDFSGSYLIVNYLGRTAPAVPGRYWYYHFGLYISPDQGTIGWYEDDIEISIP
jgi:hypothetical protein